MKVTLIAALAANRVIGINNTLPWKLSADLKRFKALTTGHTIVMGRKTFESLGRPLPGRRHICVSRQYPSTALQADARWPEQVFWCGELRAALRLLDLENPSDSNTNVFIIGGAEIYRQALPWADTLELTHVQKDYEGDAFFPFFDSLFEKTVETTDHEAGLDFTFATYRSLRPPDLIMRRAEPKDAEFIVRSQLNMAMESEGLKLNSEIVSSGVAAVFAHSGRGEYWIAERHTKNKNTPLGCLLIQKEWSDWRNGWFHWIHSLFVLPEERRRGVCRWMLKVICENAHTTSALGLRLYVDKGNAVAQTTYLDFGLTGGHYDLLEIEF
jgi:dihydrofolate reductase